MKYKSMFKIDFKEARENAGLEIPVVESIARGVGHDINLMAIENNMVKPSDKDVNLLMSIYKQAGMPDPDMNGKMGSFMKF
ncbi:MAG: hypothetical protein MJ244_00745 [Clostridia bacterium]|nr:hypothetical protein [Clostridia bacterium]